MNIWIWILEKTHKYTYTNTYTYPYTYTHTHIHKTERIGNRQWFLLNIASNQFTGKLWRTFVNCISQANIKQILLDNRNKWTSKDERWDGKYSNECWSFIHFITSLKSAKTYKIWIWPKIKISIRIWGELPLRLRLR